MNIKERRAQIYQFRVELMDVKPKVWRQIQIRGDQTFWGLHVAIQDAMGWWDCHLHVFRLQNPNDKTEVNIGIPDPDDTYPDAPEVLVGWEEYISDYFDSTNTVASYTYDFGDNWEHSVKLEKIFPAEPRRKYPKCVGGAMRCPPEDVGGSWGYGDFLDAINDPDHPRHAELKEWIGGAFDFTSFIPEAVAFDNPEERLERIFE